MPKNKKTQKRAAIRLSWNDQDWILGKLVTNEVDIATVASEFDVWAPRIIKYLVQIDRQKTKVGENALCDLITTLLLLYTEESSTMLNENLEHRLYLASILSTSRLTIEHYLDRVHTTSKHTALQQVLSTLNGYHQTALQTFGSDLAKYQEKYGPEQARNNLMNQYNISIIRTTPSNPTSSATPPHAATSPDCSESYDGASDTADALDRISMTLPDGISIGPFFNHGHSASDDTTPEIGSYCHFSSLFPPCMTTPAGHPLGPEISSRVLIQTWLDDLKAGLVNTHALSKLYTYVHRHDDNSDVLKKIHAVQEAYTQSQAVTPQIQEQLEAIILDVKGIFKLVDEQPTDDTGDRLQPSPGVC